MPETRIILLAGNHDTPRSRETGEIITLFSEIDVEVVVADVKRLVYPELDLSVLAVPHHGFSAPREPIRRGEVDRLSNLFLGSQ